MHIKNVIDNFIVISSIDDKNWDLPIQALPGETHERTYKSSENVAVLTNFRLIISLPETFYIVSIYYFLFSY